MIRGRSGIVEVIGLFAVFSRGSDEESPLSAPWLVLLEEDGGGLSLSRTADSSVAKNKPVNNCRLNLLVLLPWHNIWADNIEWECPGRLFFLAVKPATEVGWYNAAESTATKIRDRAAKVLFLFPSSWAVWTSWQLFACVQGYWEDDRRLRLLPIFICEMPHQRNQKMSRSIL